ncbi:MAG TPA: class I SAM-dependent methyltransferase [Candidatus Dormibacteraeota bacterium]|nr:class I SAM-dependent methyltransferase [Candidatus Dormibacteraeota bacterium]
MRVRDDPLDPDPGFADLYASLPELDDLWPWLDWCAESEPPVLYLGIGAGRIAAPVHRAGIEIVGVDAHPGMLEHARRRIPGIECHQVLIESLEVGRQFDLVIGPSSILESDTNLAAAARHVRPGGRIGMELMNPHWLTTTAHEGVRIDRTTMEVDYRLPDGSVVVQIVEDWRPGPAPEDAGNRMKRFGLDLLWLGGRPDAPLSRSPIYYVLAGLPISNTAAPRTSPARNRDSASLA